MFIVKFSQLRFIHSYWRQRDWQSNNTNQKNSFENLIFRYLVLVILLIRGATLPGAYDGIIFYVYPSYEKMQGLANINASRCFFLFNQLIFFARFGLMRLHRFSTPLAPASVVWSLWPVTTSSPTTATGTQSSSPSQTAPPASSPASSSSPSWASWLTRLTSLSLMLFR